MNSTKSDIPSVTTTISYRTVFQKEPSFNIADFLKHAPRSALKLWHATTNEYLTFIEVFTNTQGQTVIWLERKLDDKTSVPFYFDEYGRRSFRNGQHDDEVSIFPDQSNLFWQTAESPNLAAEIIFPRCTGTVIIDGDKDAVLVGEDEYYYFSLAGACRFHKLDYNGARFATREESEEFYDKLTSGGYKFIDGHVIVAPDNTPETKKSFKHKGFTYIEDLQQWVNEQQKIEVVSVIQDARSFSPSNFVVFYYELL